jgi:hypothetical protein
MYSRISSEAVSPEGYLEITFKVYSYTFADPGHQQTRRGPTSLTEFEVQLADM